MADGGKIPFDYIGARKAGYSDSEIASYLQKSYDFKFDITGAKNSGYSDKDIADYILKYEAPKKAIVSPQIEQPKQEDIWDKLNKEAAANQPTVEQQEKAVGKKPTINAQELQDDPFKAIMNPFRQDVIKQSKDFLTEVNRPVSESTSKQKLSVKNAAEKSKVDYDIHELSTNPAGIIGNTEMMVADQLFPNGKKAQEYVDKQVVQKGEQPDNETFQVAKAKADRYNSIKTALKNESIENLALEMYRRNNPNFDAQIAKINQEGHTSPGSNDLIPAETKGAIVARWLQSNKDDLDEIMKEKTDVSKDGLSTKETIDDATAIKRYGKSFVDDIKNKYGANTYMEAVDSYYKDQSAQDAEGVKNEYNDLKQNIRKVYPEYGSVLIANEISRERQKRGLNNPVVNFDTQTFRNNADKIASELYKDDPVSQQVYNENRDKILEKIDVPGIINKYYGGIEKGITGTRNTINAMTDTPGMNIYEKLQHDYSGVSAGETGIQKTLGQFADLAGFVTFLAAEGKIGVPSRIGIGASILGDALKENDAKYPTDRRKAIAASVGTAASYMVFPDAIPVNKINNAMSAVKKEISKSLSELGEKEVSAAAIKDATMSGLKKGLEYAGQFAKQHVKTVADLTAITMANQGIDKALGLDEKTFKEIHPSSEVADQLKLNAIINIPLSAIGGYGEYAKRNFAKESVYDISSNPKKSLSQVDMMTELSPGTRQQLIDNINLLSETKTLLDQNGVPEAKQKTYLLHTANEKNLEYSLEGINQRIEATKEPVLKSKIEEQKKEIEKHIEESRKIKDKILSSKGVKVENNLPQDEHEFTKEDELHSEPEEKTSQQSAIELLHKDVDDGRLTGVYAELSKDNPIGVLKEISQQAQGFDENWKPLAGGGREAEMKKEYSPELIKAAKEAFPKPSVPVIRPEENKVAESIPLIKKEGGQNAEDIRSDQGQVGGTRNEPRPSTNESSENLQLDEKVPPINGETEQQTGGGKEESKGKGEEEGIRLSHADTKEIYEKHRLPGRLETPTKKDAELERAADKLVESGYDFDAEADKVMKGDKKSFSDEEQVAFAKMVGALEANQEGMDINSPEFNKVQEKIEKYSRASDIVGTLEARSFRSRQLYQGKDETKADYVMREKEVAQVETLTEAQKEKVQKEFEDISGAKKDFDEYMAKKEAEFAAKQAAAAIEKQRPKVKTKKTKGDFVNERKSLKEELIAARKEHEDWLKSQGIHKSGFGSFTVKEAKVVAKIIKSYVEEGIINLEELAKKAVNELKDLFPEVTEKDIHDVIRGAYNEKKQTKSELAKRMMDLRIETTLIDKLEKLEKGQKPKSETKKIERNKQIKELREKIKSIQQAEANAEREIKEFEKEKTKEEKASISVKAKEGKDVEKELTKAEKELEKAEEDARKEQERKIRELKKAEDAAVKEEEKFIKEFEKEKDSEEKRTAKAKVDAAKKLATDLAKRTKTEIAIDTQKKKMAAEIKELEYKLKTGDFDKESKPKEKLKLDEEGLKLQDKLIKLKQQREIRLLQQEYQNRSKYQRFGDTALEVLNVPRTVMSSTDFSAPLRQGLIASISHPRTAAKAGATMFKHAFSQKEFDRWFHDLKESKNYDLMNKSGLYVADPHDPRLTAKEEAFMNNLAEKIPVIGKVIKGSERAYVSYLNKMRVDLFNRFAERYMEQGKTYENSPELYEKMADYINNTTGRGKLLKVGKFDLEAAAPILNTTLFSPRLIASRLNLLNPIYYAKLPKEVRIMAAKDMLKFLGLGMTVLALAKLNGADVEDDPRSTDFGKIKSGNTRWDIWGGFQQYVRLAAQMISGEKKAGETIKELNGQQAFGETRGDVLGRFGRGKLAPVPSMLTDFISGRTVTGNKPTLGSEAESHLLPLLYSDIKEALKDQGIKSLFTVTIPATFGVGVQTFQKKESKPKKQSKPSKPKKAEKK